MNGLIEAIHRSYSDHYPLVLSPDHIWMCIVQGFAAHVNLNAEKLCHMFVERKGKKKIVVQRHYFVKGSPQNPWSEVFSEFSVQINIHSHAYWREDPQSTHSYLHYHWSC